MSLSAIIGADASELPVCLSEVWDDGVPLDDAEKRECIRLFCLLMRDRSITEDGAKIAISEWSGNPALTESECSGAYASSEKLTCKLLQNTRYVTDRCEREFCEFPAWNKNKSGKTRAKTEQTGPTVLDALKKLTEKNDGQGFSKFDQEEHDELIKKAISEGYLSPTEEKAAYRLIKKYKKQLKKYGMEFDEIGHISRDGDDTDNGLREINERIPRWIADHHFKTVADTERLYRYAHGVYLDDGETVLKTLIETKFGDITSNRLVQDVIGKVKRRTYIDRDAFNSRNILNVKNGLLDLETLELGPHTPDYLSTAQIGVVYDPTAKAPNIQKFLGEAARLEDIPLIEEITGWLLWPDYSVHKAVMLLGVGRNGKGTLLRLLTAFLGKRSVSNVTLQDLVADRFAKADLYGKLANIGGDLPSKDLSDTAAFRNLTGGDDNRAQEKYRAAFSFRNKAKMLFSANVLPRSPDDTYAFYSRWILIEFLNIFDLQKGTADPNLDTKLQTPEELSGLLNIALTGLKRLKANGWRFSYDKTVEDVEIMYKRNSNPVLAFLMDECDAEPSSYIEKTVFNNRFNDYAKAHNIRPLSTTKFVTLLKDQTEIPVSDYRPFSGSVAAPRCWLGVRFKDVVYKQDEKNDSNKLQSTPSIVLPTPSLRENEIENKEKKEKDRRDRDKRNPGWCGWAGDRPSMSKRDMSTPERRELTPADESPDSENVELVVVRFLEPVPVFVGVDGLTYGPFKPEDVASIPALQAKGLIEKGAVVKIMVGGKQ